MGIQLGRGHQVVCQLELRTPLGSQQQHAMTVLCLTVPEAANTA
jgi:hypothetical protein